MNPVPLTIPAHLVELLDDAALSLQELARGCAMSPDWVHTHVEAGVLQQPGGTTPAERRAYRLTEKGRALMIPALALHVWSLHWLPPGKGPSMEIHHACSTSPLHMHMRCSHCHAPLLATAVEF